jgi:hypothetical protein
MGFSFFRQGNEGLRGVPKKLSPFPEKFYLRVAPNSPSRQVAGKGKSLQESRWVGSRSNLVLHGSKDEIALLRSQ